MHFIMKFPIKLAVFQGFTTPRNVKLCKNHEKYYTKLLSMVCQILNLSPLTKSFRTQIDRKGVDQLGQSGDCVRYRNIEQIFLLAFLSNNAVMEFMRPSFNPDKSGTCKIGERHCTVRGHCQARAPPGTYMELEWFMNGEVFTPNIPVLNPSNN